MSLIHLFLKRSFHFLQKVGFLLVGFISWVSMDSAKGDDGHISYDLRENPKKSWKFSSFNHAASASASTQESQCKVCGKDFESLKALYGHMRHHSRRERERIQCKECGKALLSAKSLSNHMRVHSQKLRPCNESGAVKSLVLKKKRSKRKRYNFIGSSSISTLNESLSSVTEIDQEVVQTAISLMMLSRGVQDWGKFCSSSEFSCNDSVTIEVKSFGKKKRLLTNRAGCSVSNGNGCLLKKPRLEKLDSIVLYEKEEDECHEVGSGAESDEGKKVKLEVFIEKFYEEGEFEMPKLDVKPGSVASDDEIGKESSGDLMEEDGLDAEAGKRIITSTSSKKVGFNACYAEYGGDSSSKAMCNASDYDVFDDPQKESEIRCQACNKIFCSRRALGGHQRMHSAKRSSLPAKTTMFTETEPDSKLVKLECIENLTQRENKEHKCRICLKVFATGQALGGHKRAHLVKNLDNILQDTTVEQDYSDLSNDLDLNISNTLEEEVHGDAGSEPWLVESKQHKHERLLSMMAS